MSKKKDFVAKNRPLTVQEMESLMSLANAVYVQIGRNITGINRETKEVTLARESEVAKMIINENPAILRFLEAASQYEKSTNPVAETRILDAVIRVCSKYLNEPTIARKA